MHISRLDASISPSRLAARAALLVSILAMAACSDDSGGGGGAGGAGTGGGGGSTAETTTTGSTTGSSTTSGGEGGAGQGGGTPVYACGWSESEQYYLCGGQGEDPSGTFPIGCPEGLVEGEPCDGLPTEGCCDAAGDNWFCEGVLVLVTCN